MLAQWKDSEARARLRAVVYPAPGQRDVPLIIDGRPVPDPLPHSQEKVGGYPVTVDFVDAKKVTGASIELRTPAGQRVPACVSSPADPANPAYASAQKTAVCAIAKGPLEPGTRYAVTARADVDGVAWGKSWSFVTAASGEAEAAKECALLLRRVNAQRRELGLGELRADPKISEACREHARYVAYHQYGEPPLDALTLSRKARSTPAGKRIAPFCVASWPEADHRGAFLGIFNAPSRRAPLLDPRLTVVGVGCDGLSPAGRAFVLYGVPSPKAAHDEPVVFPAPGATGVPLRSSDNGLYPQLGIGPADDLGFAASALFPPGRKIAGISGGVFTQDDKEVDCWNKHYPVTHADGSAGRYHILVPKRPLLPGTTYTAHFEASVDGRPWEGESKFTTGPAPKAPDPKAVSARLLASLNLRRKAAGLGPVAASEALSAGCARHAEYLRASRDPAIRSSMAMHDEDLKAPGFSREGQLAAHSSVVLFTPSPVEGWVDGWLMSLYHRGHILNPDLRTVGIGFAQQRNPDHGWICVVDVLRGVRR